MKTKRELIFLSGAAATGKTSVINCVKEIYVSDNRDIYIQTSITRNLYEILGVKNEIEVQNLNEEQKIDFQLKLFDKYISYTIDKLNTVSSDAIIDRSPIDYIAWTLYIGPKLSKTQYNYLVDKLDYFISELSLSYNLYFCYFPFPTPWTTDTESSDGFRFDPFGKNKVLDHIIKSMVKDICMKHKDIVYIPVDIKSPIDRTNSILNRIETINKITNVNDKVMHVGV